MWLNQLGLLAPGFILHKLAHAVFIKTWKNFAAFK